MGVLPKEETVRGVNGQIVATVGGDEQVSVAQALSALLVGHSIAAAFKGRVLHYRGGQILERVSGYTKMIAEITGEVANMPALMRILSPEQAHEKARRRTSGLYPGATHAPSAPTR